MKSWLSPKWRIWIFLAVANTAWISIAWFCFERESWLWITPVALSINCLLVTYDQVLHFRSLGGVPMVGNDPWGLLKIVNDLSRDMQVPVPKIFLIKSPSAQLFAYAKTRKNARLFISEGMLKLMTPRQLRAALIFQMLVIQQSLHMVNYWVAALLDLLFRVGRMVERTFEVIFGWTPPLAATLISPWMGLLRLSLIGAKDFERLDRETARRLDNPEDLAQALWKMDAYAHTQPWPEPWIFAHMCMVSPLDIKKSLSVMRVQPPLKDRIKRLIGRYPL